MHRTGENVIRIEAQALNDLADRIAGPMALPFNQAVELLYSCAGRVVVTGMGKSGLIARKIAATLSSTGTPSLFMHPVEALHGDLGMLVQGDIVIALSASGETEEILQLLATIKRLRIPLIAITCDESVARAPSPAKSESVSSRPGKSSHSRRSCQCRSELRRRPGSLFTGSRANRVDHRDAALAMLWLSLSPRRKDSRKKILPASIPAASSANGWRGSRVLCIRAMPFRA
jgi:hypothetical protein